MEEEFEDTKSESVYRRRTTDNKMALVCWRFIHGQHYFRNKNVIPSDSE